MEKASQRAGERTVAWRYAPSWFDRMRTWLEDLPGPYPVYYIVLGISIFLILKVSAILEGNRQGPITDQMRVYVAFIIPYMFGMAHSLDLTAGKAIEKMRQSLRLEDVSLEELQYQITVRPARPAFFASVASVMIFNLPLLFTVGYVGFELDFHSTAQVAFLIAGVFFWWVFGFAGYHTIHQLRVISRIYSEYVEVNLYQLGALYALSTVTAITSISIVIAGSAAMLLVPAIVIQPIGVLIIASTVVLAGITFAWPLWGIHRIMIEEKDQMDIECSKRYESLLNDWHVKMDNRDLEGSGDLYSAIQSLLVERKEIQKIPTWPWTPGILKSWIAALFLPLAVWTLQWLMERYLFGV